LTFTYPDRHIAVLQGIDLTIAQGEFVTLCGPSSCGKTTLLRHLKPSTAPHGTQSGTIFFNGTPLAELSPTDAAANIGFVFQSPENQIVTDKVWHELAFGLESLGVGTPEIRLRVAEIASFFGIQEWFHKSVTALSGGQKQILALASIMAMRPSVLILDEPTSQLDPIAAGEFLSTIGKINRELDVTVVLTEHRLEEAFPLSTRAIAMHSGKIAADGTPREVALRLRATNDAMFLAMPTPMRVWATTTSPAQAPITTREGAAWLSTQPLVGAHSVRPLSTTTDTLALELTDIHFKYEKTQPDIIKSLNLTAHHGEITAVLGGNGTGKTTTLSLIAGLLTPYRGKIYTSGTVRALPQNPQTLFVGKTVREDLREMSRDIADVVKLCRLETLLASHPYDLSGGEQQRAAMAKVLLTQPKILLLDEPTKGMDAEFKQVFAAILRRLASDGVAIVMVSHDLEFCAEVAHRCALFFDGAVATENTPREFFSGNNFYTTGANRMARHVLPDAITAEDIIQALGGKIPPPPVYQAVEVKLQSEEKISQPCRKKPLSKRTIIAAMLILLTIPLTIHIGVHFFDDRRFYFISTLIILQTMLPFALAFEGRKPAAREIIVIAVLCAIAVAGRSAFFMLPQFKPVIAVVIIAGVAFGGEAGFLVGAKTALVSNMFFGQGPWTPWQMFAMGIIGFLAGVLFRKGLLSRNTASLAAFGGVATFVIYGGIMNTASAIMWQPNPTAQMLLLYLLQGIPFDIIHAAATVTFLVIIARPMLEKLDRIKTKYGLI